MTFKEMWSTQTETQKTVIGAIALVALVDTGLLLAMFYVLVSK